MSTSAGGSKMADVELRGIAKRYGAVQAVAALDLRVEPGQFVSLLGPSGCGKTTTLRIIAGLVRPDAGQVIIGGRVMNDVPVHHRGLGLVAQNYALFPHMTVMENVTFGLRMRRAAPADIARRAGEALEMVRLTGLGDRYPRQLSGGQQQRVALARVLAVEPVLLLLDEPFGALDKKLRVEMQLEVKQLITPLRMTTIFVTHDQEEAMRMSDRVAVMNAGRIIQCDAPAAIYDRSRDLFVADFIGNSNLLDAKLLGAGGDGLRVVVAGVELELPRDASEPGTGEAIVMVRPENLTVTAAPPGDRPAWTGVVAFALHTGPVMEYEVVVADTWRLRVSRPRAQAGGGRGWQEGDRVAVSVLDLEAVRVFPAR